MKRLKKHSKCQHDINISPNTVCLCSRECLVYPPSKMGYCLECGENLTYVYENGQYVLKEGNKDK